MSHPTLTKTRFAGGVWEGLIEGHTGSAAPELDVMVMDQAVPGVTVTAAQDGGWALRVPVPAEVLGDGYHTFLVSLREGGAVLGSFAIMAGDAVPNDLLAEVDLLRAELDMLKRAFRRHCVETG